MSSTQPQPASTPKPPSHYYNRATSGDITWLEDAIEDYLGLYVTDAQRRICRALVENENLLIVTANGLGKSYILAAITNVWLLCLYPAAAFATSGTEAKMRRTYCRPVKSLHNDSRIPLPGTFKHSPPRIDVEGDPEHFFEASSPKDAGELEGVHSAYTLAIIEEADKDDVDHDVVEAMESLVVDERDRIIAIANPPVDEVNVVYDLMQDPEWEAITFSSFESHNVQVELGEIDGDRIDGLATLHKIKKDWRRYNGREWPGVEVARQSSGDTNLDERWYKRRLGEIPPDTATAHRPFTMTDVEEAFERPVGKHDTRDTPTSVGIDVARSGDKTVMVGVHGSELRVHYAERGDNHAVQKQTLRQIIEEWPGPSIAVDAVGEGSGLADDLNVWFPDVTRFSNGGVAADETTYATKWAEGLHHLGQFLEDGSYSDRNLREELMTAASVVTFSERYLSSRGANGATVIDASSKDDMKEELEHSPDYLDAALMAVWRERSEPQSITQLTF